jgi:hypothetical protein
VSGGSSLNGDGFGGGILNLGALTLANAGLVDNVAVTGGGIADFGVLVLGPGTVVTGNRALGNINAQRATGNGGGIAEFGALTASGVVLAANHAAAAGGNLAVSSSVSPDGQPATRGTAKVDSTTIRDGAAGAFDAFAMNANGGGAIIDSGDSASFTSSTFSGNVSGRFGGGGAIFACGSLTLTNDTVARNGAPRGGAIFAAECGGLPAVTAAPVIQPLAAPGSMDGAASPARTNAPAVPHALPPFAPSGVDLNFVTMADNAGGIVISGSDRFVRARNSIVASCRDGGRITSLGHNLETGGNTCGLDQPSDMVDTDPKLGPLQDNGGPTLTMALAHGTPAVDAADPACGVPVDQRGITRPQGAHCDIGAFELQMPPSPLPLPPVTGASESRPPASALLASLLVLSLVIAGSLRTLIGRHASGESRA